MSERLERADPSDLHVGEIVGDRYEVVRLIREGIRKRTYLARDLKLAREVALSVARPETVRVDPNATEREAKVLGRIGSHDNIVSVYDYEQSADAPFHYTVFEYLTGGTLEDLVQRGPLPPRELLRLSRQVTRGLAHLHGKGVLHRDIVPKNVLFDERQVAHLGDFDSAILLEDPPETYPEITDMEFVSPEERGQRSLDVRSDLYSLGCLLYVAATGHFELGEPKQIRQRRPELPTSFAELVASLLSELPEDRPANAEFVLRWLDDVRKASNIEEVLASSEESGQIEFKASLLCPYPGLPPGLEKELRDGKIAERDALGKIEEQLELAVLKTIAGFLNSDGGMLLIGVSDRKQILGIERDLSHRKVKGGSLDGWSLHLTTTIRDRLGADAFDSVRISLVRHGEEMTVAVVSCQPRNTETWLHDEFHVRTANATQRLEGPRLVKYVRGRWPSTTA
jgi:serine/threonine protein kinase